MYFYLYIRTTMVRKTYPISHAIHFINIALWLTFQACGFVWKNTITTVLQLEYLLLSEHQSLVANLSHPQIILGVLGQILLLVHAFRRRWNRGLNTLTVSILTLLVAFLVLVGVLTKQWTMVGMQLPFLICVCLYFYFAYKKTEGEDLR